VTRRFDVFNGYNGPHSRKGTSTLHFYMSTTPIYGCDAEVRIEQRYDMEKRLRGLSPGRSRCVTPLTGTVQKPPNR